MENSVSLTEQQRLRIEDFRSRYKTGVLILMFTDMVNSTAIKQELGDIAGNALIKQQQDIIREILLQFPEAEEINTAGDSFFIVFIRPSDAVQYALLLVTRLREVRTTTSKPIILRIGIHMGEVFIEKNAESKIGDILGIQVDTAHRVMSLAGSSQILMTRGVFDNARAILRSKEEIIKSLAPLSWLNHGPYRIKGIDELLEICEVGEEGLSPLTPPMDSEKGQRFLSSETEPVLGWRPALEQPVPRTEWILEEKLGEGGFGEVWLARHKTMKDKRVFKFCFRADRVRSLKREVIIFRLLKEKIGEHPNIVRLYDVYFDTPPYYIAMEYVEGKNLTDWCMEQGGVDKVPLQTRLEIVAQVAEALQAAHDSGVVHRDIKPTNILITQSGSTMRIKLTDFGIGQVISKEILAQITTAGFTDAMHGTELSSRTGTRIYMAPEVIAGKLSTPSSDIYSLGIVFYQLVVGDLTRPLTTDWRKNITDPLLTEDFTSCFAGTPAERFSRVIQLAESLRSLESRRKTLAKQEKSTKRKKVSSVLAVSVLTVLLIAYSSYSIISKYYYLPTVFITAAENGDKAKVEDLIKKGVDINTKNKNGETALIRALKYRQKSIFNILLKNGANVNTKDSYGYTPLMYAVDRGSADFGKLLLAKNADVNAKNNKGETALMIAAYSDFTSSFSLLKNNPKVTLYTGNKNQDLMIAAVDGDTTKVQELLNKNADINIPNSNGDTPLILAARNRKTDVVKMLLNNGARIYDGNSNKNLLHAALFGDDTMIQQCLVKGADINTKNSIGDTPLIIALKYRHSALIPILLNYKGIDINAKNKYGITALMIASARDDQPTVQALIKKGVKINDLNEFYSSALMMASDTAILQALLNNGAEINIKTNDGVSPLMKAVERGDIYAVQILLNRGANVDIKDATGTTPLWWAASLNHTAVALALLEKGADPNAKKEVDGMTPLMYAANNGNTKLVQALLNKRADPNLKMSTGMTALILESNNEETIATTMQLLLDYGADVNVANHWGFTALHFAAQRGRIDKVNALLDKGVNVDLTNINGETPLILAANYGHLDVVQRLQNKHADINTKEKRGWTPLIFAAYNGHTSLVKFLLEQHATLNEKNDEGKTALMLAQEMNHPDIIVMLKKAGAK